MFIHILWIEEEFEMTLWDLVLIAAALSMDAFAVSICKGLSVQQLKKKTCVSGRFMVRWFPESDAVDWLAAGCAVSSRDYRYRPLDCFWAAGIDRI